MRTRWRPRSRSPSWNHASPPSERTVSSARHVSSARPQPRCSSLSTGERVEDRVEVGRDVQAEHLEVVADVADDGDVARLDDVRRGPGRTALRRPRRRERRPSSRETESGQHVTRSRPGARRESHEVGELVCIVTQAGARHGNVARRRLRPKSRGALIAVERREDRRVREPERVRRSVLRRGDGDARRGRRLRQRLQVVGTSATADRSSRRAPARHRPARAAASTAAPCPPPGSGIHRRPRLPDGRAGCRIRRHDPGGADVDGCGEHIHEHRTRQLLARARARAPDASCQPGPACGMTTRIAGSSEAAARRSSRG